MDYFSKNAKELSDILDILRNDDAFRATIHETADMISHTLSHGIGKVLIAGNGGSASTASHFAGELVGRYKGKRKALPCINLSGDSSVMTCIANDYGFENVFARQVEAYGEEADVFVGLSTSGNSSNIIKAVDSAKSRGLETICLLGKDGGKLKGVAKYELIVPSDSTARIQEVHDLIMHTWCDYLEPRS